MPSFSPKFTTLFCDRPPYYELIALYSTDDGMSSTNDGRPGYLRDVSSFSVDSSFSSDSLLGGPDAEVVGSSLSSSYSYRGGTN